ncbi:hypothetical protein EJB05_18757, partial [Eragrostis curvula]
MPLAVARLEQPAASRFASLCTSSPTEISPADTSGLPGKARDLVGLLEDHALEDDILGLLEPLAGNGGDLLGLSDELAPDDELLFRWTPTNMVASGEFSRVFASFDQDGDGKVTATELGFCMKAALGQDMPAEDVKALMASADTDGDGLLDEEEFVRLARDMEADQEETKCRWLREAFRMYEMEGRGCITPLSLKLMLGKLGAHQDIAECQAMICRFDLDGDGVLSFDEFKTMMMG